ncbi:MAG: AMP-binding protein [Tannerellaceae bacterium]|nr:AMP-binding protein [Tannerellaceae bacterium]
MRRQVRYVTVARADDPLRWGIGECSPLPGLSCDELPDFDRRLSDICRNIERTGGFDPDLLRPYPSILFALETAFRHLETGSYALWDTAFSRGEAGIPINGLIWMSDKESMLRQIDAKLADGFRCIKLKIGAIDFADELSLLKHIRRSFSAADLSLRVDANGAFPPQEATAALDRLAAFDLEYIEQPLRAGQWDAMARLVAESPVPVALDEELTGCNTPEGKRRLLYTIRPHFLILKPTLHGGIGGCGEWIAEALRTGAGCRITSALESNIGLNAIAQWCATLDDPHPQGLGTGSLYTTNVPMPLELQGPSLHFKPSARVAAYPLPLEGDEISTGTSGSTGQPRQIRIRKEQIAHSAGLTIRRLGLCPGNSALLCLPRQYIGGLMMTARSLAGGLRLLEVEASGHPLAGISSGFDLIAMTPMQAYNSLLIAAEKETLRRARNLLIGGGAMDAALEKELAQFPNAVYSTYGMTETVSHIALRRINGPEASEWYEPLPGIELTLSVDNTLIIAAPQLSDTPLRTNDIAELRADGRFRILGRSDLTVNSGGLKIQIEQVEDRIRRLIPHDFALTHAPDPRLGQALTLLVADDDVSGIRQKLADGLPPFERPRRIIAVPSIPLTPSGKIDRPACLELGRGIPSEE